MMRYGIIDYHDYYPNDYNEMEWINLPVDIRQAFIVGLRTSIK